VNPKDAMHRMVRRVLEPELRTIRANQVQARVALGTLMSRQIAGAAENLADAEFRVFSQFGEDGVIEFLVQRCTIVPEIFIEIGVEDYSEANTRFLAEHRGWRGLVIDLNPRLEEAISRTQLNWRSQVQARSAFVTRDNAADLVSNFGVEGSVGLLSIDIDGVDYWVLERLLHLHASVLIVEYNSLFGYESPITVPYSQSFDRRSRPFHNIYYGASLAAFEHLLSPAGYALVGCTNAGNNAFFVKRDRLGPVAPRGVAEAFRPRRFVEHRDSEGRLTGIANPRDQLRTIQSLPVVDLESGVTVTIGDALLN